MSTTLSFKDIENKHDVYRGKDYMKNLGKDYMKNLYKSLKEHTMKIIDFKRKK